MRCYKNVKEASQKCSLIDPVLDAFFSGGLSSRSITEITGEAGAAKTQLCLQLLLAAQLPLSIGGLNGSAVYIFTEGKPPIDRLKELSTILPYRLQNDGLISHMNVMDNVFIETAVSDGNGLLLRLRDLRMLLQNPPKGRPIKALIVDSITYPFRGQDEEDGKNVTDTIDGLKQRTEILFSISSLLRRYADEFNLVVVVTNQVSDNIDSSRSDATVGQPHSMQLWLGGRQVVPALGLAWSQCINTRVLLSKLNTADDGAHRMLFKGRISNWVQRAVGGGTASHPRSFPQVRRMQIVFSPYLPPRRCSYIVDVGGLRGLRPEEMGAENIVSEQVLTEGK